MKKIGIVLLILISLTGTLLGCGKQDVNKDFVFLCSWEQYVTL